MNSSSKNNKKSSRGVSKRAVNQAIGKATAALENAAARRLAPRKKRKRSNRERKVTNGTLTDSNYALAVAFPESSVEGRLPDQSLAPTSTVTIRLRDSIAVDNSLGYAAFVVNPTLVNHIQKATITAGTSTITAWTGSNHEDYSTLAANFARYRPIGVAVRILRSTSSMLDETGEIGSVQLSGGDTTAYPTGAGSFTTITNYESEAVMSAVTAFNSGGYRRVWIPPYVPVTNMIAMDSASGTYYGCQSQGAMVFYLRGLVPASSVTFETYMKLELVPFGDTSYLFEQRAAIADESGMQGALLKLASMLASAGTTVEGAVRTMEKMSVMSALNKAGALIGRAIGIGAGATTLDERVVQRLLDDGKLDDVVARLTSRVNDQDEKHDEWLKGAPPRLRRDSSASSSVHVSGREELRVDDYVPAAPQQRVPSRHRV